MRKCLFLFFLFFSALISLTLVQKSFASYPECETGAQNGCNPDGSWTGHVMLVTQNSDGSFSCHDQGAQPSCVQQVCPQTITTYPECETTSVNACNPDGSLNNQLTVVSHCPANDKWYCWNQGPQPGCGLPSSTGTSPSPASSGDTASITLIVGLPGIGFDGIAGVNPHDLSRSVIVELYDANSSVKPGDPTSAILGRGTGIIHYDTGTDNNAGYFVGTIASVSLTGSPPANNEYEVLVKMPQYLYKLAVNPSPVDSNNPHAFTISGGTTLTTAPLILSAGDTVTSNGNANSMGLDDYNALLTCFHAHDPNASSCAKTPDGIDYADLDDNGFIDIVDFNLFIRSIFQLQQLSPPVCNGLTCQGD